MIPIVLLYPHPRHALLNIFQWDIKHTGDIEWGDNIHTTGLTLYTYLVPNALCQYTPSFTSSLKTLPSLLGRTRHP